VDLSYCGCAITECSCGLEESKQQLTEYQSMLDKANQAILNTYNFLKHDVEGYTNNHLTKDEFLHELKHILISLETYVPICDPDMLHGNFL